MATNSLPRKNINSTFPIIFVFRACGYVMLGKILRSEKLRRIFCQSSADDLQGYRLLTSTV